MATLIANPARIDLDALPGIPEYAAELVSRSMDRDADPECFDATRDYIAHYMRDVNSELIGVPEPLSYYAEAASAYSAGYADARDKVCNAK